MTNFLTRISIVFLMAALLASCGEKEEPELPAEERSILIYAVASNNLDTTLHMDLNEILDIAPLADLNHNSIWVYYLTNSEMPALYKLERDAESKAFAFIRKKSYDREQFSTDPRRISRVIADYKQMTKAGRRGIIFWSHSSSWTPNFSDHTVPEETPTKFKSFGWDTCNGKTDHCDLIEFADAIPADTFDFIWFDCCYMGSIEVAYQLRDKCEYMVGYPTEVWGEGMPYDLTIPYILHGDPRLKEAAKAFADYYHKDGRAVTVGVYDMAEIEKVAEYAESCVTAERKSVIFLQNYGRNGYGPYVDLGQYVREQARNFSESWDFAGFQAALDNFVIYKSASSKDFSRRDIRPENFSGVTTHYFMDTWEPDANYYMELDWFRRVYTTIPEF